jgi:hypothetical protein
MHGVDGEELRFMNRKIPDIVENVQAFGYR